MAIAQNDFNVFRGRGYEGQASDINADDIKSRIVTKGFIPYGRAVCRGTGKRSCAPITATTTPADIIGFSIRSMAEASPTAPANGVEYKIGYPVDHVASIMHRGSMYAVCADGAKAGDPVMVITRAGFEGMLSSQSGTIKLDFVKWADDVAAGEIGEIQVDGIFAAP